MGPVSVGDMAQSFMLKHMTAGLKQNARVAAQELTSGWSADTGSRLRGDLTQITGLEATLSKLKGYEQATNSAALKTSAMQTALQSINTLVEKNDVQLLTVGDLINNGTSASLISDVAQRFDTVIATLNTKVGDSTLFAGVASDGPAIASSDTILSALETAITSAGAVTAQDIEDAVTAWFDSPTGFASVGYIGGAPLSPLSVSADDRVDLSVTGADPAIRNTLKAFALSALVDRGNIIPDEATGLDLARRSGTAFLQSNTDRVLLAGKVGLAEARIDQAKTRNMAEDSALKMARLDLLSVDPEEAVVRVNEVKNKLDTLYAVTERLSRLSLVDFLR